MGSKFLGVCFCQPGELDFPQIETGLGNRKSEMILKCRNMGKRTLSQRKHDLRSKCQT